MCFTNPTLDSITVEVVVVVVMCINMLVSTVVAMTVGSTVVVAVLTVGTKVQELMWVETVGGLKASSSTTTPTTTPTHSHLALFQSIFNEAPCSFCTEKPPT
jgi:hypothetical protein